ncbi:DUF6193 family natural product biosynthesis protein [Streptomyces griseus]|uniref:DUF6193 family natural product biosynthesis protein n=1 Tax=Streptomyces griseus TaxID=1911 RepID=UPI00068EF86D|nr:DUF6193 family natural product biosynthesis protein [Streptomyces griseus]
MSQPPEPAALYPEVVAAGSLAAALRSAAGGALDGVPLTSPTGGPFHAASVGSVLPHREPLRISAWKYERKWSVSADERLTELPVLHGETDDLAEVARVVRAWHDGEPPEGVRAAAPFARPTGRLELDRPDPARIVAYEWRALRTQAAELATPWASEHRELVEAAWAVTEFRELYPFTSHWALRFSSATRPHLDVVGPVLWCTGDGGFRAAELMSERGAAFGTAREAVEEALRLLPDGLGPVRYGRAPRTAGKTVETPGEA